MIHLQIAGDASGLTLAPSPGGERGNAPLCGKEDTVNRFHSVDRILKYFMLPVLVVAFAVAGCGDDESVNPPGNQPPTANAGPDQTVTDADDGGDEDVTLDGSGSTDSDGTIASYVWTESAVQIATGATPTVTFAVGAHTVTLTVTDDEGATDTDDVVITVNPPAANQPPTANAGLDQTVTDADDGGDEDVTLDGSGSTDSDGTIAGWVWTKNAVQIATGATPTVTFAVGAHTVTLTVTDDQGATDSDDVLITVNSPSVSFATDIQPYFDANCVVCHSGGTGQKGVNLDSWAAVLTDGNSGPVVVPGDSNQGTLVPELESGDMPPGGPAAPADFIQDLKDWIDAGAPNN